MPNLSISVPNLTTSTTVSSILNNFKESSLGQVLTRPDILTLALFLSILIVLCGVGNALVCRTIFVTRRLHFPGYYFVASLAVADFLVGVFVLPLSLAYMMTFQMKGYWIFGEAVCDVWVLASMWFGCASILNLCAVTWDRYIAVTSPLLYVMRMSDRHVIRLIVGIWSTSFIAAIINCYGLKMSPTRVLCEVSGLPLIYSSIDFLLLFLLPLVCVVFVNCKIWIIATRQLKRIQAQVPQAIELNETQDTSVVDTSSSQSQTSRNRTFKKEIKTFRTFLIVIGSFFCSWTPFYLMVFIDSFSKVIGVVAHFCVILTYVNSASNPLIYGIFNREFRNALFRSLKCRT
ncbi:tyramine receptor 1-like [Actinia tenebrosa]|uniref:Tyramine receptor 1-like n=1 Tax=Actinia tenebrosa TaxID=6105 RepID=A0A6P8IFK3_ACTTE|nr:tyramine receptor 1-like [Actinia tenebrosa]